MGQKQPTVSRLLLKTSVQGCRWRNPKPHQTSSGGVTVMRGALWGLGPAAEDSGGPGPQQVVQEVAEEQVPLTYRLFCCRGGFSLGRR